jgi:hypothetical protein
MQKLPTNDIQGLAASMSRSARVMPLRWARIADDCGRSRNHCCRIRQLAFANVNTFAPPRTRHLREISSCRPQDPARSIGQHASVLICRAVCGAKVAPSIRPDLWRSRNKDSVRQARLSATGHSTSPPPYRSTRSSSHRRPQCRCLVSVQAEANFLGHECAARDCNR